MGSKPSKLMTEPQHGLLGRDGVNEMGESLN
jgi:hypothetical protein